MTTTTRPLQTGDPAILFTPPARGPLAHRRNHECKIIATDTTSGIPLADVEFASDGLEYHDLPLAYLRPVPAPATAPALGVHKSVRTPALRLTEPQDTRSEAQKQAEVKAWFEAHGYIVFEVGKARKGITCQTCGTFAIPTGYMGNTPHTPDVFLTHPTRWPCCLYTCLEMKKDAKAARANGQVALVEAGRSVFVWSLKMAIEAVYAFEDADPRISIHPALVQWKAQHIPAEGIVK